MSSQQTYHTRQQAYILDHDKRRTLPIQLLHDEASPQERMALDALVASGDCFITLATKLDTLIEALKEADQTIQPELERLVADLLYLQRHYQIVKKQSNYRQ
jgi:hypothetical protein